MIYWLLLGIPVVTNAREVGIGLLKDTLNKLDTYGSDSNYNKLCRKICQYRLSVFEKYTNVEDIEQHIHEGQIEELLIEMEEEYDLMIQINENPEFKEALESVGEEQAAEWKHYNDPIGANTTLTFVTPEMLRQLHDEEFEKSIWEEIDKELDEEGIPRLPKQTIDEKVLKQYADNAAL